MPVLKVLHVLADEVYGIWEQIILIYIVALDRWLSFCRNSPCISGIAAGG